MAPAKVSAVEGGQGIGADQIEARGEAKNATAQCFQHEIKKCFECALIRPVQNNTL
jgi:hypothetical protein